MKFVTLVLTLSAFLVPSALAKSRITSQEFGTMTDGQHVQIYKLTNKNGMEADITNFGGIVQSLKVAAKSGGRDYCTELGLPELKPEFVPPLLVGDVGSNPAQYGNSGILLNSEGLKNWLFGPLDGPPRNTAQIGMPG